MNELICLLRAISGKKQNKINTLNSPLETIFGVNLHLYYRIDAHGGLTFITRSPDLSEYYFFNEFYKSSPFLKHPDLVQPGFTLGFDPRIERDQNHMDHRFHMSNHFSLVEKENEIMHVHFFATKQKDYNLTNMYLNNLERLKSFCNFFRKEADEILEDMKVDFKNIAGVDFYKSGENMSYDAATKDKFFQWMKKTVGIDLFEPLSSREVDCLRLLLEGKSSSLIGKQLHISHRTVDHHVEHIREKLMCATKAEIFSFVAKLKKCGGELSLLKEKK